MIEICEYCNRVKPETEVERHLEANKTVAARQQKRMAELSFQVFEETHRHANFWVRNADYMFLNAVFVMLILPATGWLVSRGVIRQDALLSTLIVSGIFAYVVGHLTYIKPGEILRKHRTAVRNAFAIRHRTTAGILGFEVSWKN